MRPSLTFRALGQDFEIFGTQNDTLPQGGRCVVLGYNHVMIRSGDTFYSTGITKNRRYSPDSRSCAPYLIGLSRLGGFDRKQAKAFKAQCERIEQQQQKARLANTILTAWDKLEPRLVMMPEVRAVLKRLARHY